MDVIKWILVTTLLASTFFYTTHSMSYHKKAVSLYTANDSLLQLDFSNINSTLFGKDTVFFIEFYSSWCGHCIHFAPIWRQLAADTYQWSRVVQLGAINCASEENFPVCTAYEIKGFPTIKFFPALALQEQKGLEVKQTKDYRVKIVDYVEMHLGSQRPKHWPIFRQLDSKTSYDSLHSHLVDGTKFSSAGPALAAVVETAVILVFHRASSPYEPKYVALHLSSDPRLRVFGVNVDSFRQAGNHDFLTHFPDLRQLNGTSFSTAVAYLLLFPSADSSGVRPAFSLTSLASVNLTDAVALQKRLKQSISWTSVGLTFVPQSAPKLVLRSASPSLPPPPPKGVFMSDLRKGIRYALLGEIGLRSAINPGSALDAVNAFVSLLTRYFPGDDASTRFLRQINGWLQSRGNVSISGREWRRRVSNALFGTLGSGGGDGASVGAPASEEPWIGCRGSQATLRGYPCSLWTLFHVLSVAAADANAEIADENVGGREVVETMAQYITNFFGCRECASHFEDMITEDLDDSVQSYDDVILWLWKAHNKVNDRLKGASSEDPQAPKIQFPDIETCLSCRIEGNQAAWHYLNVKRFLKNYYRNITGAQKKLNASSGVKNTKDVKSKKMSGIESIEGSVVKPNYRPGEVAKIKKQHRERRKQARALVDHLDVEKLRQRERETRRRSNVGSSGVLGFTDWDVRICFGAYGFCAIVLVLLYLIYVDRRCRHRCLAIDKRRRCSPTADCKPLLD